MRLLVVLFWGGRERGGREGVVITFVMASAPPFPPNYYGGKNSMKGRKKERERSGFLWRLHIVYFLCMYSYTNTHVYDANELFFGKKKWL